MSKRRSKRTGRTHLVTANLRVHQLSKAGTSLDLVITRVGARSQAASCGSVPLYLPAQTSSVFVISILAIYFDFFAALRAWNPRGVIR